MSCLCRRKREGAGMEKIIKKSEGEIMRQQEGKMKKKKQRK